jgi:hypothetical protein
MSSPPPIRLRGSVLAAVAALALALPATSMARPADTGPAPQPAATTTQLTPGQLRAINGHQPLDPPAASQSPVTVAQLSAPDGGTSGWLIALLAAGGVVLALAAVGGLRVATHRPFLPGRQTHLGA